MEMGGFRYNTIKNIPRERSGTSKKRRVRNSRSRKVTLTFLVNWQQKKKRASIKK